tara:strand:- start:432 stop:584 length:153 start_codon:yes stop_codon:yes gene_type:complete
MSLPWGDYNDEKAKTNSFEEASHNEPCPHSICSNISQKLLASYAGQATEL